MGNMKIGFSDVESALSNIKKSREELIEILEEHNRLIEELKKCYRGTNGDEAYDRLTKHSKIYFDGYVNGFDVRMNFAAKAVSAYQEAENERIAKIEELSNVDMAG